MSVTMSEGFIYVLKNPHMPRLVKIGYTQRSPIARAIELSKHTGVPGSFSVVKSWRINDAAAYEKRIFAMLAAHRKVGEHFQLSSSEAVERINVLLRAWGQIDDDGLTQNERAQAALRQREMEKAEKAKVALRLAREIESDTRNAEISAAEQAWKACRPLRKKWRIRAASIWSSVCFIVAVVMANWGPESTRSQQASDHAVNFAFATWSVGMIFVLLGPASTPEYDELKESLLREERKRILAKHRLPAGWTPPVISNEGPVAGSMPPSSNPVDALSRDERPLAGWSLPSNLGEMETLSCSHCNTINSFTGLRLESFKRSRIFTCQKCGTASDARE
jgi:hypothetical protein